MEIVASNISSAAVAMPLVVIWGVLEELDAA